MIASVSVLIHFPPIPVERRLKVPLIISRVPSTLIQVAAYESVAPFTSVYFAPPPVTVMSIVPPVNFALLSIENPMPDFKSYFNIFKTNLKLREGQEVHFELGRAIVAQCGSLITRVTYVKKGTAKQFVITDAGMTDLIRPALYQAHHKIENITSCKTETEVYDVVGPICESSDCFGEDETLPITKRGDLLAMRTAGAYGEIMASRYNLRSLPNTVYSK